MAKFPKTLFIKREYGNNNDSWLLPHENFDTIAEAGETVRVGVYKLVEMREAKGVVTHKRLKLAS